MMLPSLRLVFKENMIPQFPEILSDFCMDHAAIQASVKCSGALSLLVSNVKRSFSHTIPHHFVSIGQASFFILFFLMEIYEMAHFDC